MSKIMIAVDLSSYSTAVVAAGMELARNSKSPVILLTILDKTGEVVPLIEAGGAFSDDWTTRVNDVAGRLEAFKAEYPDVTVNVIAMMGNPKQEILEQAQEHGVTTLVVGTQGRTGLDHLLVGSTAEYLIRHAHIPVMVIPYKRMKH